MTDRGTPGTQSSAIARLAPLEQMAALEFARCVRERMAHRVLDIRVFGSRSRGEARPDSDLDIIVLLDEASLRDRNEISDLGSDLLLSMDLPFPIAPRVMAKEHFERLKALERLFAAEIERDGIPL
jgi:predicted nucleotidyltransferase